MPLLTLITQQSLDEDYRVAAERRQGDTPAPRGPGSRRVAAAAIAVFGVLVSTAFVQHSRDEDVESAGRLALTERIEAQRTRVDALQADIAALRSTNAELQDAVSAATEREQETRGQLRRLRVSTGFSAVRGPGVRIVVDNAPGADPLKALVQDSDLAMLVNGLWSAGAEAISIDGQRLTALSAIRNSGMSIKVNRVAIAPPYVVLAIGDTRTLQARLVESSGGQAFDVLAQRFGFTRVMENDGALSLPSGPQSFLSLGSATAGTSPSQVPPREMEIAP